MFIRKMFLAVLVAGLLLPLKLQAATLYLEADKESYKLGDTVVVDLRLKVDKQCINTVEATLEFPRNILSFIDFLTGESMVSVWLSKPAASNIDSINQNGRLYLAGGIPGGYCGRIPGDPGKSDIIGQAVFKLPGFYVGEDFGNHIKIKIADARVLANDGLGSEDALSAQDLVLKIGGGTGESVDWRALLNQDKTPPEPFVVELHQGGGVYGGQSYIVFNTVDKQTGIDHYEVIEIKQQEEPRTFNEKIDRWIKERLGKEGVSQWQEAKTPYLLKDQSLQSVIKVKAVDKAGNERVVEYIPPEPKPAKVPNYVLYLIIFVVLLLVIVIWLLVRWRRRRRAIVEYEKKKL